MPWMTSFAAYSRIVRVISVSILFCGSVSFVTEIGHARGAGAQQAPAPPTNVRIVSGHPDTQLPAVAITAPVGGSTISGSIAVSATASDNVGVVGVQFKLDGANLGAEDTTAPVLGHVEQHDRGEWSPYVDRRRPRRRRQHEDVDDRHRRGGKRRAADWSRVDLSGWEQPGFQRGLVRQLPGRKLSVSMGDR